MNIFLIGFMGSGKTTAGKKLASRMKYRYIDLDTWIEEQEKMSIKDLFEKKGETYFRNQESKYLRETAHYKECVISTGGGAPCFFDNMDYMNKHGVTVYLKLEPNQLFSRLKNEKTERPLIKSKKDTELLEFIKQKLKEREEYYKQAHWIIDGYNLNISNLYNKIRGHSGQ